MKNENVERINEKRAVFIINKRDGRRGMQENVLAIKSKGFALNIIHLYRCLTEHGERVMSKQLLRSGTSIGANIAEAVFAQTRADFITKLSIALKEASETRYWLELLIQAGYIAFNTFTQQLLFNCTELIRLLVASVKTTKNN